MPRPVAANSGPDASRAASGARRAIRIRRRESWPANAQRGASAPVARWASASFDARDFGGQNLFMPHGLTLLSALLFLGVAPGGEPAEPHRDLIHSDLPLWTGGHETM